MCRRNTEHCVGRGFTVVWMFGGSVAGSRLASLWGSPLHNIAARPRQFHRSASFHNVLVWEQSAGGREAEGYRAGATELVSGSCCVGVSLNLLQHLSPCVGAKVRGLWPWGLILDGGKKLVSLAVSFWSRHIFITSVMGRIASILLGWEGKAVRFPPLQFVAQWILR